MGAFSLTANNDFGPQAAWHSVPLGQLEFPQVPEPYDGTFDDDFWPSRHSEYNRLEWDAMDWDAIREQLGNAADQFERHPQSHPDLELEAPTIRERTFLEMWFGYGDPSVEASDTGDGHYRVGYGQHRVCAYADYPMNSRDRTLMRIPESGFLPSGPLAPDTRIPVLTH